MSDFFQDMQAMVRDILKPSNLGGLGQVGLELVTTITAGADPDQPWLTEDTEVREVIVGAATKATSEMVDGETVYTGDTIVTASLPLASEWRLPSDDHRRLGISFNGRPPVTVVASYANPPAGVPVAIIFVVRGAP